MDEKKILLRMLTALTTEIQNIQQKGAGYYNATPFVEKYNSKLNIGYKFSVERFEGQKMTFKLMAEQLYREGAEDVHLFCTHGIFSKGLQTLRDSGIKRIFTHRGEVL